LAHIIPKVRFTKKMYNLLSKFTSPVRSVNVINVVR